MNDHFRNLPVLVVGGLGFIGSHLTTELVRLGARVTVLDALLPTGGGQLANIDGVRDHVWLNLSDLRDAHTLPMFVKGQAIIFNLAAQTSHINSMRSPLEDLALNCQSPLALLECCRQHNPSARLIFTSTRQIYGRARSLPVDESHPAAPSDINGIHKLTAESYYAIYGKMYGMASVTLRLTNTFGPGMDLHPEKGFIGVFIAKALRGELIELFGDGSQRRDFNYVSDVVSALLCAGLHADPGHQLYNLGHDQHYSLKEFVELLGQLMPLYFTCKPFPPQLNQIDIGDYYSSYQRFHAKTGWRPQVALEEGLKWTIAAYQSQAAIKDPVSSHPPRCPDQEPVA